MGLKIIAFNLALLMFFTSMGFSLEIHYCQKEIQSYSLLGKAKSCSELSHHVCHHEAKSCHNTKTVGGTSVKTSCRHDEVDKGDCDTKCCHNKSIALKSMKQDMLTSSNYVQLVDNPFIDAAAYILTSPVSFTIYTLVFAEYLNYKPPLLDRDILVLNQIFLI